MLDVVGGHIGVDGRRDVFGDIEGFDEVSEELFLGLGGSRMDYTEV